MVTLPPAGEAERAHMLRRASECITRGELAEAYNLYYKLFECDTSNISVLTTIGRVCAQQGRFDEALGWMRVALDRDPGSAPAHFNLANVFQAAGRADEAVASYERALALKPDLGEAHNNIGSILSALGRHDEARACYERAVAAKPDYAAAHSNLGTALRALGRHEDARMCYQRALALQPDLPDAHKNLGGSLHALGRHDEAKASFERALTLRPDDAEAHAYLGALLAALERHENARACYERALQLKPGQAELHKNLSMSLHALGRNEEAKAQCERALALRPNYPEALNNLAVVLQGLGEHERALACLEAALALRPDYAGARNNLGGVLYDLDRCEEAIAAFEHAVVLRSDYAEAHNNLGSAQEALGLVDEARRSFERAIALAPRRASFYRDLASIKTFTVGDPHLRAMEALAREVDALPPDERIHLHFAIGSALADVGEHERAFAHFRAGNALKRQSIDYDEANNLATAERIRMAFTPDLVRMKSGRGEASAAPVFILGMPRSGSTLVEQILAGHPDVFAAGERSDFAKIAHSVRSSDGAPIDYPEFVRALDGAVLREIGQRYVARLRACAPAAFRITDKLPTNWLFVGLIHLALPNARIIHTRRDALDTCFSCFTKLFSDGQPWSYELGELGRHYRSYSATMAHWRAVLPPGAMLEVRYEDVVADLEGQARRILAHCDLGWNAACLDFKRVRRPVRTASAGQVRRPLYQSSIGRWRAYAGMLRPLVDALGPELTAHCG